MSKSHKTSSASNVKEAATLHLCSNPVEVRPRIEMFKGRYQIKSFLKEQFDFSSLQQHYCVLFP